MTTDDLESTTAIRGSLLELDREHKSIYNPRTPKAPAVPPTDDRKVKVSRPVAEHLVGVARTNADIFSTGIAGNTYLVRPEFEPSAAVFRDLFNQLPLKPTYRDIVACLHSAGISEAHLPKLKDHKYYFGEACRSIAHHEGFSSVAAEGCKEKGYQARYTLGTKAGLDGEGEVGDPYGNRACILTLDFEGNITFSGLEYLGSCISGTYRDDMAGQVYTSQWRKGWGRGIMESVYGGQSISYEGVSVPLTSCDELAAATANSLIADIAKIRTAIDGQIRHATKNGTKIGSTAAVNAISRLELIAEKAKELDSILNGNALLRVASSARTLIAFLDDHCDDDNSAAIRGANIWADLLND
jgi:hypothetical protein